MRRYFLGEQGRAMAEPQRRRKNTAIDAMEQRRIGDGAASSSSGAESSEFMNLLKSYKIEARIGGGGQGTVRRVRRLADGKLFACKSVRIRDSAQDSPRDLDLVRQEVGIMERLHQSAFRGAVGLEEVIVDSGFWHIVLELCACSLHDRIQSEAGLSESEAALLIKGLAKTVQELHSLGIVHRDLKPPNVLLTSSQLPYQVKVADFGLSILGSTSSWFMEGSVGTPKYLAPEVLRGDHYDKRVDVWGLGLILYEAVSGITAFAGLESDFVMERLSWVDTPADMLDWSGVSSDAKELIKAMLFSDPRKRLTTYQIQRHPWVVKNTTTITDEEEFVPQTPSRIVKLRRLNGRWVSDRKSDEQQQQQQQQQQIDQKQQQQQQQQKEQQWQQQRLKENKEQQQHLKRKLNNEGLRSYKKLKLRCVNGLWQVVKPCPVAG